MDSITGNGVTNRVFAAVAIGLVEQMHPLIQNNGDRNRQSFTVTFLRRENFADFLPLFEIVAGGNANSDLENE